MKKTLQRLLALSLSLVLLTVPALALDAGQCAELLREYYVDEIPQSVLDEPTVEGMLSALGDPYTEYFDAAAYAGFMDSMKDSVTYGLGVSMRLEEGGVLVAEVLEGLGAQAAGIKAGDLIVAVDGKATAGESLDTVKAWISGEEGTTVRVAVLREGARREFTVKRMKVVTPATTAELLDGHIGYIDCRTFGPETQGHFEEEVERYGARADRWIVDLRSNLGGDINAAVQAAGTFAGGGDLTYLRDGDGYYGVYGREEDELTMDPVVVLVDEYSASSAEIFASIIRDKREGLLVGSRTYGKGVAQVLLDESVEPEAFSDGSALKVTSSRFFSPNGATNDKVGIFPDLLVPDENAPGAAYLLSGSNPKGDNSGILRLNLKWRWYIDLETAVSAEFRADFTALLEAVPQDATLWMGTGGADRWRQVTPGEAAEECGLTDFTPRGFLDTGESPYAGEIGRLATYGVVAGAGNGAFLPDENLTRSQLCVLLAQALRYTAEKGKSSFADVAPDAWYAPAVEALYSRGLIAGGGDGLFHPEEPVDHQQLAVILARAAKGLSMGFFEAVRSDHAEVLDDPALEPWARWAREGVWLLDGSQVNPLGQYVSLFWAPLTEIDPEAPATRGEAAALLHNVLVTAGIL